MPGIQLSGLASGLDWRSLVDKLIETERVPQDRLRSEKALGAQRTSALGNLSTQMTALRDAMKALSGDSGNVFSDRSAKLASATSTWSVSAGADADTGTYQIQVTQLATKAQRVGGSDVGSRLSATSDVSGLTIGTLPIGAAITAGDFTVNGARITVAATDSLQAVFDRINTQTGGAVTASYDPATDKVRLSSAGEIVLGSANDSSSFLTSLKLFNNGTGEVIAPKALGVVSIGAAIANANLRTAVSGVDGAGAGTFSINGVDIGYNVNTDTVSSVLARINASDAGVTAAFDRVNDRFTLSNKDGGDLGISVSEAAGGLLESLGLGSTATLSRGKNTEFNVNGGETIVSTSNTLDSTVHGIAGLSITATSETTETITVGTDTAGARKKIDDFIAKYNAVQTYIEQQTRSTTNSDGRVSNATLAGNREVTEVGASLRSKVFDAVPGLTGTIQRLEGIGIDFKSGSSLLEVKDATKLDAALTTRATDVRTLFSSKPNGVIARLDTYLAQATGATGTLTTQTATISRQAKTIDDQIAAMDRRITQQRALLEQSFISMESAQSRIQTQLAALTNAFGTKST